MLLIGAHMSIAGGMEKAFDRGEEAGCSAMQVFTKNASRWEGKPLTDGAVAAFRQRWAQSSIGPVIAHDTYLINLAAPEDEKWDRSIAAFVEEMERCSILGIPQLVMHPGAHMGEGEQKGIERVCAAFRRIFAEGPQDVSVLLENTAGQGTNLGWRFEHLSSIAEGVPQGRFGVCFDTCHAFVAGYDISTPAGYAAVMEEFDRLLGIGMIKAFHVNDCKKGLGSRVDRHEHLGRGSIGETGFRELMRDTRFAGVPKILETPKSDGDAMDRVNLALLRQLAEER